MDKELKTLSKGAQKKLSFSKRLVNSNSYVNKMYEDYADWVFDEQESELFKDHWREKVFNSPASSKMDIEIGPGSGNHFCHLTSYNRERLFVAIELKYKPLIQTARRLQKNNCVNARIIRHNGRLVGQIFGYEELNNVYIHFPDPWPKKRHYKHRLIKPDFVNTLYHLQRTGMFVEIKTDSKPYIEDIKNIFKDSSYHLLELTDDLHKNIDPQNFITPFERIFIKKGVPVYYVKYFKRGIRNSSAN